MNKLESVSLFVGTGECNGRCEHCAGVPLRKYAPKQDGVIDSDLIVKTVRDCYGLGARNLSISSSGEPTLSPMAVTKTLELISGLEHEGIRFNRINLYSNGIRIGEEEDFSRQYLKLWQSLGLTRVYVTVHSVDEKENARLYGVNSYPSIDLIVKRIHDAYLLMRANMVLSKKTIGTFEEFVFSVEHLMHIGVDGISAWPVRTLDDKIDRENSPDDMDMKKIEEWAKNYGSRVRVLGEKNKVLYEQGKKLTLFPDGKLSSSWCN